jgi:hypothetical protein
MEKESLVIPGAAGAISIGDGVAKMRSELVFETPRCGEAV